MSSYPPVLDLPQTKGPELVHSVAHQKREFSAIQRTAWSVSAGKRLFDILFSAAVLIAFSIPMMAIAVCIRLTSRGPAIFVQKRVGRHGRLFSIYKFRSMTSVKAGKGVGLTRDGDSRVTRVGGFLRKLKLDELPQFYNILRGDMSVVGPRPKLAQYSDPLDFAYRPGITGAATLAFRQEEQILACVPASKLEDYYHERIKPLKATIDQRYMRNATFRSDVQILLTTLCASLMPTFHAALEHHELEASPLEVANSTRFAR